MAAKTQPQLAVEPAVGLVQRELVMKTMDVGHEARRFQRQTCDIIALRHITRETDGIGARGGCRWAQAVNIAVAESIGSSRLRMRRAEQCVVQQHQPDIGCGIFLDRQFTEDIAAGQHGVGHRLDGTVAARIGLKINRAVLGKVNLAGLAMWPQELACMIAAGHGDGIKPKFAETADGFGHARFSQIPRIGIDRAVAHASFPAPNQPSFR